MKAQGTAEQRWDVPARDRTVRHRGIDVMFSDHCLTQLLNHTFDGRASVKVVLDSARDYVRRSRITGFEDKPAWVNGSARERYLVSAGGKIVFPLADLSDDGRRVIAVSALQHDRCKADLITRRLAEAGLR